MTDLWLPDWTVAPGEILAEALEERGMSQAELGRRMARPLKTISEIVNGKAAITPDTAIQLERALDIAASVWLGLESNYRESLARTKDREELDAQRAWLDRFPIAELADRGVIRSSDPASQVVELLRFFRVSSPTGWDQHWGQIAASYRMRGRSAISRETVATWLCLGEWAAAGIQLGRYDPVRLRAVLDETRTLSRATVFAAATDEVRRRFAEVGVAFVLIEGLPGAPASGAVRWVRDNPVIEMTLRYRSDDHFWFSLYHEAGHLLEGGKRAQVIEDLPDGQPDSGEEQIADAFARECLVPTAQLNGFLAAGVPTGRAVRAFAKEIGVSPGIVVGRLQRDGVVGWSSLNELKGRLGPQG